tara:strand:+ start:810 stop:1184 length:375 start_codon:yes stop_codon:yes gene_type:complete
MNYPKEIYNELWRLKKRMEQIGEPNNDKEALELGMILSKSAEIQGRWLMDMLDNKVADQYSYKRQSLSKQYIVDRLDFWHKQLGRALDKVSHFVGKVDPKEYETMLIRLNEWDYILNYIIRSKD